MHLSDLPETCISVIYQRPASQLSTRDLHLSDLPETCISVIYQRPASQCSTRDLHLSDLPETCISGHNETPTGPREIARLQPDGRSDCRDSAQPRQPSPSRAAMETLRRP